MIQKVEEINTKQNHQKKNNKNRALYSPAFQNPTQFTQAKSGG